MKEKEKDETREEEGGVLMHLKVESDDDIRNFGGHLQWWFTLAKDTGRTLVLEARLK